MTNTNTPALPEPVAWMNPIWPAYCGPHSPVTAYEMPDWIPLVPRAALAAQAEELARLRAALQEADTIMGHDDAETEWRVKWAHLWPAVAARAQGGTE